MVGLIMLLLSLSAHAQILKPGYIVKHSGDTVRGYILPGGKSTAEHAVEFHPTYAREHQSYSPMEITAYGIDRRGVWVSKKTSANPDIADRVFMEQISQGEVNFYYYNGSFFMELMKDGKLRFMADSEDNEIDVTVGTWKNQSGDTDGVYKRMVASVVVLDCPDLKEEVQNMRYTRSSFKRVMKLYYEKKPEKGTFFKDTRPPFNLSLGAGAVPRYSSLRIKGESFSTNVEFDGQTSFQISLQGELIFNRTDGTLSFLFEYRLPYTERFDNGTQFIEMENSQMIYGLRLYLSRSYSNQFYVTLAATTFKHKQISRHIRDNERLNLNSPAASGFYIGIGNKFTLSRNLFLHTELNLSPTINIADGGINVFGNTWYKTSYTTVGAQVGLSYRLAK